MMNIFAIGDIHGCLNELTSLHKKILTHDKFNAKNDLIILTLPTPKQEEFAALIMKNKKFYKILCVGGAINMSSGLEKPVPNFIEKLNLEFLWRLRTDTTRRLKRLCISALHYVSGEFFFKFKNINKKIIDEE